MPTSSYKKIGRVLGVLAHIKPPSSVLDVGVGFGKYGFLLREHLDIRKRRYSKDSWVTRIDGVESWKNYLSPIHAYIYNHVFVGDVRELVKQLPDYQLIVLADVIEHMSRAAGVALLTALYAKCERAMVISFPNTIGSDWQHWPNPLEKHEVVWKAEDFKELFPGHVVANGSQVVYVLKKEVSDES